MSNPDEKTNGMHDETLERITERDQEEMLSRLGRLVAYTSPRMKEILFCGTGRFRSSVPS